MTTYNTGNPLGSAAAKDLYDNAENFDHLSNNQNNETWGDRFGQQRLTWHGIEALSRQAISSYGYITLDSFESGNTLTLPNQVLRYEASGEYFRWDGVLPKEVPVGSTPDSTGGIGSGKWLSVGDAALRADLKSQNDGLGDSLIGVKQPITGWPGRTQHDRNFDYLNLKDAAGNTIVGNDWTSALQMYIEYLETLQQGLTPPYAPPVMDIPPGDYGISAPLWFKQAVHIRGKGVRIYALPGFIPATVELQAGGTELYHGMFLFLNGKKGSVSGEGQLRFNVTIDEGLVIDCKDIAYPNIYSERFVDSTFKCTLQSSPQDALVIGPDSWGLNTNNLILENFTGSAIRFEKNQLLMEQS